MRHAALETSNVALFYLNTLLTIFPISIFIAFSPYFLRSLSHPMASCLFLAFDFFFFKFFFISFLLLHSYRSGWELFFFFFPCVHREPHQFPTHIRHSCASMELNLRWSFGSWDLDERLICLRRDSFRPSQTHRSWPLGRHFVGSSFIPSISSLIHTQKVFNFKSNCSYFVKECDFVVFWEYWNCYLFWFENFSFGGKRERTTKLVLGVKGEES